MTFPKFPFVGFLVAALSAGPAAGAVIDFSPLTGQNGDRYFGHQEAGFSITPSIAKWSKGLVFGNPKPNIFFGPPLEYIYRARLTVTRVDFGLFTFKAIDTWSQWEGLDIAVQGYRNGAQIFWDGNDHGLGRRWLTFTCSYPTRQVDTLVIDILAPNSADSMGVDNIVVDPVPEPSTLFVCSCGLIGLLWRRR